MTKKTIRELMLLLSVTLVGTALCAFVCFIANYVVSNSYSYVITVYFYYCCIPSLCVAYGILSYKLTEKIAIPLLFWQINTVAFYFLAPGHNVYFLASVMVCLTLASSLLTMFISNE